MTAEPRVSLPVSQAWRVHHALEDALGYIRDDRAAHGDDPAEILEHAARLCDELETAIAAVVPERR